MRHSPPIAPQFYVTAPQPCPYLPGRAERKLFTALLGSNAADLNDTLSRQGFRRSQNVLYRPACNECTACMSARIPVADFVPSRSQRRITARNAALKRANSTPWATEDQYDLFRRYLDHRHAEGGMAEMDIFEYAAMVEETPVRSRIVEYYRPDHESRGRSILTAVCLTVYSFFDPALSHRSLGTWMILDHVRMAREAGLAYVYLGYWVPGSAKMHYKSRFRPLQVFRGGDWQPLIDPAMPNPDSGALVRDPVADQVAAIQLPSTGKP
jgi:leucyl-tRNA---protein transferase